METANIRYLPGHHPNISLLCGWLPVIVLHAWFDLAGDAPFGVVGTLVLVFAAVLYLLVFLALRSVNLLPSGAESGLWRAQCLSGAFLIGLTAYLFPPDLRVLVALCLLIWVAFHLRQLQPRVVWLGALAGLAPWSLVAWADSVPGQEPMAAQLGLELILLLIAFMALASVLARMPRSAPEEPSRTKSLRDAIEAEIQPRALEGGEIMEVLAREMARVDRHGGELSVCIVELDDFDRLHVAHGREVSDSVLETFGHRVLSRMRQMDIIGRTQPGDEPMGRYGGQEYMVVLPATDPAGAEVFARRIRDILSRSPLAVPGHGKLSCTASIGIASYHPGERIQDLVMRADEALRRARREGGDRVMQEDTRSGGAA